MQFTQVRQRAQHPEIRAATATATMRTALTVKAHLRTTSVQLSKPTSRSEYLRVRSVCSR
jgi:superfamily II DNA helicase RecQ